MVSSTMFWLPYLAIFINYILPIILLIIILLKRRRKHEKRPIKVMFKMPMVIVFIFILIFLHLLPYILLVKTGIEEWLQQ